MPSEKDFSGTVVRVEADGFGIVEFDGPSQGNTHGVFSTSISDMPSLRRLKPGVHVSGIAQFDDRDMAAVRKLSVD